MVESLIYFRNQKLLNIDLLNIFPIKEEFCSRSIYYEGLYNAVLEKFQEDEKLIPTITNTFASASDSMLLGDRNLTKLINQKRASVLFGRSHWINTNISHDNPQTKELAYYFHRNLHIYKYDLSSLVERLDNNFLINQSDQWLIKFYKIAHQAIKYLWGWNERQFCELLKGKPIIRIQSGKTTKQILPFSEDGKPNVFLPIKRSKYITVKESIAKNKSAKSFLSYLGITVPDIFAEINEYIIPKFREGIFNNEYLDDIRKIISVIKTNKHEKLHKLLEDLQDLHFILGVNLITGKKAWLRHDEVYIHSEILVKYFKDNNNVFYVDERSYILNKKELVLFRKLILKLGVSNTPNRIKIRCSLYEKMEELHDSSRYTEENYCNDYKLEGLENYFDQEITLERSLILWKLLIERVKNSKINIKSFFQGKYSYKKRVYNYGRKFESMFCRQLKEKQWIYNGSIYVKPKEISISELPNDFLEDEESADILTEILGFRPDEVKKYLEKTGKVLVSVDEYKEFQELRRKEASKNTDIKDYKNIQELSGQTFNPDFGVKDIPLNVEEYSGLTIKSTIPHIQQSVMEGIIESVSQNENEAPSEDIDSQYIKDIGRWGECYVKEALIDEYLIEDDIKVVDLNQDGNTGIGCDFTVLKDDEVIKYIEVKSTIQDIGHPLSISGVQWQNARNQYDLGSGDMYNIYCVFNVGKKNATIKKISNPFKMWKDGKLFAHPINIIVK